MFLGRHKIIQVMVGLIFVAAFILPLTASKAQDTTPRCPDARFIEGQNDWLFWNYDFDIVPIWQLSLMPHLERFRNALAKQGVQLIILPIPSKGTMVQQSDRSLSTNQWSTYASRILQSRAVYQESVQNLSARGFQVVDLIAAAQQAESTRLPNEYFFLKSDHHWSAYGARIAAQAITKTIKERFPEVYNALPKQRFTLQEVSRLPFLGSVGYAYKAFCQLDWAMETVPRLELETLDNDAQSLLNDTNIDVVLAGTSNSQSIKDFNFPGFLSRELGSPLLNYSDSARFLLGWLSAYLTSDEYSANKPKVLIYEFPLLFWTNPDIKSDNQLPWLRHMIPSVYGACSGKNRMYSQKITTQQDLGTYSLFKRQNSTFSGNQHYLHLTTSNKNLKKVQFLLTYKNSAQETIELNFETNTDNNGQFYLELSDKIESTLVGVEIKIPSVQTVLTAQICRIQ